MSELGRMLIVLGVAVIVAGLALVAVDRIPWLGRLPGDLHFERANWSFYFPIATSVVVSLLLTLVLWLIGRR